MTKNDPLVMEAQLGHLPELEYHQQIRQEQNARGRTGVVGNAYRTSRDNIFIDKNFKGGMLPGVPFDVHRSHDDTV